MRTEPAVETRRTRAPVRNVVRFNADAEMIRPVGGKVQLRTCEIKGVNLKKDLIGEGVDEEAAVYELCYAVLGQLRAQGSPSLQHALALISGSAAVRMSFKLSVLPCVGSGVLGHDVLTFKKSSTERTIGVSWPHGMQVKVKEFADRLGRPMSAVARSAFVSGLTQFDARLENEASAKVLASYQSVVDRFQVRPTTRFMLRLNRKEHGEAVLLARELRMSLSQLAVSCIAWSLVCDEPAPLVGLFQESPAKNTKPKVVRKKSSAPEHG